MSARFSVRMFRDPLGIPHADVWMIKSPAGHLVEAWGDRTIALTRAARYSAETEVQMRFDRVIAGSWGSVGHE